MIPQNIKKEALDHIQEKIDNAPPEERTLLIYYMIRDAFLAGYKTPKEDSKLDKIFIFLCGVAIGYVLKAFIFC